ncbi:protein phosphatase 2C domain-containing protein [uncultured Massilia sp.]|uniref:protein phosphatase 2C domain-containing protein n=1 Tax=uncultured Massilia sp. TaxID=169973 RepID=UPI00258EF9BC|nr:protein phosphatase 2C domain-containing protein [uncultured Massilia sp.]
MHLETLTSGATAHHNEDWAGAMQTTHGADLIVLDGATSVAERDYIDPVQGDVCWFVSRFAEALGAAVGAGMAQDEAVEQSVAAVSLTFDEHVAGQQIPLYAWPIAALSWVRVRPLDGGHRLDLYCLGDCTILMRGPDGVVRDLDPFVNPQEAIVRAEVARLSAAGIDDPADRMARLLPMLRERRVFQNTTAHTNALCLRPKGGFGPRRYTVEAPAGASVLVMSDGFFRLVDTYGLHTPESLFALCTEHGLQAALDELRRYETAARAGAAPVVKAADDASAVLWCSAP